MDPDANLNEQRELAASILETLDVDEDDVENIDIDELRYDVERLAELVQSLDTWISRGGFLPKDWRRP